jgi:LmbE family N-acetylglucosaminyl deacetylase
MRKLMAIFAHPDDEGATAGTLAHYARRNSEVILVCATNGEVGQISDPSLASPETLGLVRQKELEAACKIIGIRRLEFLGYRDSGMEGAPENSDPRALVQADSDKVTGQIVGLIRRLKPDIVITFEPFGWYGHPDHQVISRWATSAFALAGDAGAYPDSGPIWQPQSLFQAVLPISRFQTVIQEAVEAGFIEDGGMVENIPPERQLKTEAEVTHAIEVKDLFELKRSAMSAHQTQFSEDHIFRKIPMDLMLKASGSEYFIQAYPPPKRKLSKNHLKDLFTTL